MESEHTAQGPDLEAAIVLADLGEGEPFLGRAAGKPLILVRRRTEVAAICATCREYGGRIAEGRVVGDALRCPRPRPFLLKTGRGLRAPPQSLKAEVGIEFASSGSLRRRRRNEHDRD